MSVGSADAGDVTISLAEARPNVVHTYSEGAERAFMVAADVSNGQLLVSVREAPRRSGGAAARLHWILLSAATCGGIIGTVAYAIAGASFSRALTFGVVAALLAFGAIRWDSHRTAEPDTGRDVR